MLANALFCTAIVALLASTILTGGIAMTRAAIHRAASAYVAGGYQHGIQIVESTLAADMQNGGLPSPLPPVGAQPPQCADAPCRYFTTETAQFTTVTLSTPSPSCDIAQSNCANGEESNAYVAESRVTSRITVVVSDPGGNSLATKSADVTFRTLRRPPYAIVAGFRDGGFDDVASEGAPGDDGGLVLQSPAPCASAQPGTSDDTSIRVAYQNEQTNACTDASTFAAQSYSQSPSAPAGWSP